jgi:hypothetical protein
MPKFAGSELESLQPLLHSGQQGRNTRKITMPSAGTLRMQLTAVFLN